MTCIGIDPAAAKPVAMAWRAGKEWRVRSAMWDDAPTLCAVFRRAALDGCTTAVIEDGYVGANPRTALALSMVRGTLVAWARQAGLDVRMVAPATWQAAMLSQGGWRPRRHDEIVRMARFRAGSLLGRGDWTEDECVAAVLAEWGDAQPEHSNFLARVQDAGGIAVPVRDAADLGAAIKETRR